MAGLGEEVRDLTDALDAAGNILTNSNPKYIDFKYFCIFAGQKQVLLVLILLGNTTAAIGKGFAIGSACLVSLALFSGYVSVVNLERIDILEPFPFAGLGKELTMFLVSL